MISREREPNVNEENNQTKIDKSLDDKSKLIEKKPDFKIDSGEINNRETLDFRFNQSDKSRLAEYITGLRPDNPKMPDRLIDDQGIIRAKYGLPARDIMFDLPGEYEHFLRDIAKENKVDIRSKSDSYCAKFFKEFPLAAGAHIDELGNMVGIDIDKKDPESYIKSLGILEHELIHAIQQVKYPKMPIELCEYEAYIAGLNVKGFKDKPEDIEPFLFGFFIGNSVNISYAAENKKRARESKPKLKPKWKNPEFFLKNIDKISTKEIKAYEQKLADKKALDEVRRELNETIELTRNQELENANEFIINPDTGNIISDGQEYANTQRMRAFIRVGNSIRESLPPVPDDCIRLWRGNRPDEIRKNPSFTNALEGIALPFLGSYGGKLSYVDIPKKDLEKYEAHSGVAEGNEFIIPKELAKKAISVSGFLDQVLEAKNIE